MNPRRSTLAVSFLVAVATWLAPAGPALASDTDITYPGELKQGGNLANGPFDMTFALWDALNGGSQVGSTLVRNGVQVTDGRFTVTLDFGPESFLDTGRWLEIEVEGTTLAPRQPLTASPFAIRALLIDWNNLENVPTEFPPSMHSAGLITSGWLSDARLSNNVGFLAGAQTFSGAKTFATAATFTNAGAPFVVASNTLVANLNADLLDGLHSSAFLQSVPNPLTLSGSSNSWIIKGENASTAPGNASIFGVATGATGNTYGGFFVNSSTAGTGVSGISNATSGTTYGVRGQSSSTGGYGLYGSAIATTGTTYGVYGRSASNSGRGVYGEATDGGSGVTYGGYFDSNSTSGYGVYATSAGPYGVYGIATAATGTTYGGRFENASTSGRGVYGVATAASGLTWGVFGQSDSSTFGRGVLGHATANVGEIYGVHGISDSTSGSGVHGVATAASGTTYGVRGQSSSTSGYGVLGYAGAFSGITYGVHGESLSTTGRGVSGWARATTGTTYGVYGQSDSTSGRGVFGEATATSGSTYGGRFDNYSTSGRGVYAYALAGSGATYGVRGQADSASGYGVYAVGDLGASGTKSFRIDHPDDPENMYLLHYAAESPEVINFYSGMAEFDERGEAVVELPAYFAKINTDPRYTLTAVGAPMPNLHIAREIDNAALNAGAAAGPDEAAPIWSFRIAGGAPGAKVSWRIEAVRNDRWIQMYGAPVEVEKQDLVHGLYQHPEIYGESAEMGMDYQPER